METVSNIASGVSKAIWGDPEKTTTGVTGNESVGTEPISGEVGDIKAGEPYDMGNIVPATTKSGSATDTKDPNSCSSNPLPIRPHEFSSGTEIPSTTSTTKPDSPLPTTSLATENTPAIAPIHPENETSKTGVTSVHSNSTTSATDRANPGSSNDASGPTPSVGAAPTIGSTTSTKERLEHKGISSLHDTLSSSEHQAIKETQVDAKSTPIGTAKKHESLAEQSPGSGGSKGAGIPGVPGSEGLQKESHGEGTGEKYIRSSGMRADGGDFDASNPGAGREADRLLEAKGIHREVPAKKEESTTGSANSSTPVKETASASSGSSDKGHSKKPSLVEKIKAKVHKH
ncbi:hypothetical protein BGZ60DRAFT_429887 [Tricladium varicosporioides]|nr:hypothetical protein BGZ60DRAFT_429887 [Hymenoscyphus varicosporioides]